MAFCTSCTVCVVCVCVCVCVCGCVRVPWSYEYYPLETDVIHTNHIAAPLASAITALSTQLSFYGRRRSQGVESNDQPRFIKVMWALSARGQSIHSPGKSRRVALLQQMKHRVLIPSEQPIKMIILVL